MAEKKEEMVVDKAMGEVKESLKKVSAVVEEVVEEKIPRRFSDDEYLDFDVFKSAENDDSSEDSKDDNYRIEEGSRVYEVPCRVRREESKSQKRRADGSPYYNYYVGYSFIIGGVQKSIVFEVEPPSAIMFQYLDVIFGNDEYHQLEVVKTEISRTNNGRTSKQTTYNLRVSGVDEDGSDVKCTLNPRGRGMSDVKDNLIAKLKSRGYID